MTTSAKRCCGDRLAQAARRAHAGAPDVHARPCGAGRRACPRGARRTGGTASAPRRRRARSRAMSASPAGAIARGGDEGARVVAGRLSRAALEVPRRRGSARAATGSEARRATSGSRARAADVDDGGRRRGGASRVVERAGRRRRRWRSPGSMTPGMNALVNAHCVPKPRQAAAMPASASTWRRPGPGVRRRSERPRHQQHRGAEDEQRAGSGVPRNARAADRSRACDGAREV